MLAPPRTHDTSNCNALFLDVTASGYFLGFSHGIASSASGACDDGTIEVAPIRMSTAEG